MKFTRRWPKEAGYYWFVDIEYPQPVLGFIQDHELFRIGSDRTYHRKDALLARFGIRIGDRVDVPACTDCVVTDEN